jgi:hypothetical protein
MDIVFVRLNSSQIHELSKISAGGIGEPVGVKCYSFRFGFAEFRSKPLVAWRHP